MICCVSSLAFISVAAISAVANLAPAENPWWNTGWRMRTTITTPTPYRDDITRVAEAEIDFPLLLERAGVSGEFDPASLRVIERRAGGDLREVPFAYRTALNDRKYLTWYVHPETGRVGTVDIYFDTRDRGIEAARYNADALPPENLIKNPYFEDPKSPPFPKGDLGGFSENGGNDLPADWSVTPSEPVRLEKFAHSTGSQSLKIIIDENTPKDVDRTITLSQKVDVRGFAGQEMVFECDLMAERAAYGAPVSIELQQFREDGSQIPECIVQPRWLSIELAQGQLVQFCERGRLNPEAATVNVYVRVRCTVNDADTRARLTGPESFFTVWLDRFILRPGELWPWPSLTNAGFVEGALEKSPLNRGFEFTGQRRLAFNGASEGTLTMGIYNPNVKSIHWGLEKGTLEFWCRPNWGSDDGAERVLFEGSAYGHRLQSRLRTLNRDGKNQLEFAIADAECELRTVRGPASLRASEWHHIAATWDFPRAHLQLFMDGKRIAEEGPGPSPWVSSLVAEGGNKKSKGIGITEEDTRSLPMQAFIGGDKSWTAEHAANAVLDEFRVSDIPRYTEDFTPAQQEFETDSHTRVLFHFENERDGLHDSDDRFVRGHLSCELPDQEQEAPLEILKDGSVESRMILVKPHPTVELFEANRAESRMTVSRPFRKLPDPRFVEYREREIEHTVRGMDDTLTLRVEGDFEPLMRSVTFQREDESSEDITLLPRWRANDNVVPFSVDDLAATLGARGKNDAEKAYEAFKYTLETTNYYDAPFCETLPTQHRPRVSYTLLKALNIYPFDQCGPMNHMLRKLFLAVGISSSNASGTHHQFEQAFYDGKWRLFDLSSRVYWLERDNATALSRRGMEEDPYLKLRQGGDANAWLRGRRTRATFGSAERPHSMDFPMRSGERVSICWHNEGRWFEVADDRKPIPLAKIPPYFGNGSIVYEPTEGKAAELDNIKIELLANGSAILCAQDPGEPASLIYRAQCPYIFSDGRVTGSFKAQKPGAIKLSLSFDEGKNWTEIWHSEGDSGQLSVSMLEHVTARYAYWLKLSLDPDSSSEITNLNVRTTFVASPLALPGKLSLGDNRISFAGGPVSVPVKTSCSWVERHKSDLGVSLNALSYYMNDDEAHRNLFVAVPGSECPVSVSLQDLKSSPFPKEDPKSSPFPKEDPKSPPFPKEDPKSPPFPKEDPKNPPFPKEDPKSPPFPKGDLGGFFGEVSLEGLPDGWTATPGKSPVMLKGPGDTGTAEFALNPKLARPGEIHGFQLTVREGQHERRIPAQILVAEAPLVSEAEQASEVTGKVSSLENPEASGGAVMAFAGEGKLGFDLTEQKSGTYALWLRARWEKGSSTNMTLELDGAGARRLRAQAMIGFTNWTDNRSAHTKMFAHFGEQYSHWSWYRIPDVDLKAGMKQLTIGAGDGAQFDALVLLPQNPVMDRAAMNLFQNWNYAPWDNSF